MTQPITVIIFFVPFMKMLMGNYRTRVAKQCGVESNEYKHLIEPPTSDESVTSVVLTGTTDTEYTTTKAISMDTTGNGKDLDVSDDGFYTIDVLVMKK